MVIGEFVSPVKLPLTLYVDSAPRINSMTSVKVRTNASLSLFASVVFSETLLLPHAVNVNKALNKAKYFILEVTVCPLFSVTREADVPIIKKAVGFPPFTINNSQLPIAAGRFSIKCVA
jgi:hypothetical protein